MAGKMPPYSTLHFLHSISLFLVGTTTLLTRFLARCFTDYTAEFLLTRGPYALLGYTWAGCTNGTLCSHFFATLCYTLRYSMHIYLTHFVLVSKSVVPFILSSPFSQFSPILGAPFSHILVRFHVQPCSQMLITPFSLQKCISVAYFLCTAFSKTRNSPPFSSSTPSSFSSSSSSLLSSRKLHLAPSGRVG